MSTRAELGRSQRRPLSWALAYGPAAAFAVLLPKCPLGVAAPLALLGLTTPLPAYARTLAIAASLVFGTLYLLARRKRATPRGRTDCCDHLRTR